MRQPRDGDDLFVGASKQSYDMLPSSKGAVAHRSAVAQLRYTAYLPPLH